MKAILIGYGEIGKGIYEVYSKYHEIDIIDLKLQNSKHEKEYDVMLVTIPYTEEFVQAISEYKDMFNPKATIIFSTVSIGTTEKFENAVHVPIEGKHPYLAESIQKWQVFMGGYNNLAYEFFVNANKMVYMLESPKHTEFMKLQSTSNYGLMIEYARYVNEVCKDIGLDYKHLKTFNMAYNSLYKQMGSPNFQRYILNPPEGNLGGHCVVPNAIILDSQYPSDFLKEIYRDKENDIQ